MRERPAASAQLCVHAPDAMDRTQRRTRLEDRVARNVAVLFGVQVPDAPAPRTWVADFNLLRVGDIGRGAPSRFAKEHPSIELDDIPPALLHRYKPDTKSALILVAAERLFADVETTMRAVLKILGTSDDGQPLAEAMQLTVWASLVVDAYLAQPALFAAAVQARAVQRAAASPWRPVMNLDPGEYSDLEFQPPGSTTDIRPDRLGILDSVVHDLVSTRSPMTAAVVENEGGGPSDSFLIDSLIDRWIRHLMYSADHGMAWLSADGQGTYAQAFVPRLAAVSSYASDAVGQYSLVVPMYGSASDATAFDPSEESHVLRMIPRVPSLPEIAHLERPVLAMVLRSATLVCRVLRDSSVFNTRLMQSNCRDRLIELAELSASVLGPGDLTTIYLDLTSARTMVMGSRDKADFVERGAAFDRVLARVDDTRRRRQSGELTAGEWMEQVNDFSATVNGIWQDLAVEGEEERSVSVREQLSHDWDSAMAGIGLRIGEPVDQLASFPGQISGLLHNYIGFQLRLPDLAIRISALELGREVLLPRRREVAEQRRNDTAMRTSLQVLLRGACLTLAMADSQERRLQLLDDIVAWRNDLVRTSLVRALERDEGPYRTSQLNCLETLAFAEIELAERGLFDDWQTLARHVEKLERVALDVNGADSLDQLQTRSARARSVRETIARFKALQRLGRHRT